MPTTTAALRDAPPLPAWFDEDGFLIDPLQWNQQLAAQVAELDGLGPLDDRHWRVIGHLRARYFRVGGVPAMRLVCRATQLTKPEIRRLFGSCRAIWRIAGLPNPGEEAKAYIG